MNCGPTHLGVLGIFVFVRKIITFEFVLLSEQEPTSHLGSNITSPSISVPFAATMEKGVIGKAKKKESRPQGHRRRRSLLTQYHRIAGNIFTEK